MSKPNRSKNRLALPNGTKLNEKYVIKDVLGSGGFGITYLASNESLNMPVAIKELLPIDIATRVNGNTVMAANPDDEQDYDWARQRFIEEAQTLVACAHPAVVQVFDVFSENGTAYIVTKYVEGVTFSKWVKDLKRTPRESEIRDLFEPLLRGLEVVHEAGFLHRDVKPDNIYVTSEGSAILLDFGSARQAITSKSRPMTAIVTPGYAPFEQYYSEAEEDGSQGPWSDLYAIAAVILQAITGTKPPEAPSRIQGANKSFQPLQTREEVKGNYSLEFLTAIDEAFAVEPENRPQSVKEFLAIWNGEVALPTGPPPVPKTPPSLPAALEPTARTEPVSQPVPGPVSGPVSEPVSGPPSTPPPHPGGVVAQDPSQPPSQRPITHARPRVSRKTSALEKLAWLVGFVVVLGIIAGVGAIILIDNDSDVTDTDPVPGDNPSSPVVLPIDPDPTPDPDPISIPQPEPEDPPVVETRPTSRVAGETATIMGQSMVWAPPGRFTMGSPISETGRNNDESEREVEITNGFYIGKYEVSQSFWAEHSTSNPSVYFGWSNPVDSVTYSQIQEFLEKLNRADNRSDGLVWRLPTEAEWEYACRAGSSTVFGHGNTLSRDEATFNGTKPYDAPEGERSDAPEPVVANSRSKNNWGIYNMHGNVFEWCHDWYSSSFSGAEQVDPVGPSYGIARVARGGSWRRRGEECRSASRHELPPENGYSDAGFRVVLGRPL
ncbi:MAG: bifunctional serine/threonine-protein kinase/formylglycine-generating enzyme family protein [Verrucomicrobiota bacterium]